ncbi:MAG: NAD-dependent epimerase/dehydratase family protein, partial [Flavobacteriaceae bacterium]|nr:NAD-dependent epimerase/dehydratase family protein [Flavobacteriaceae bacterium]
ISKDVKVTKANHCRVRDVRKTPDRDELHFFTGEIEQVKCLKLAVLGTDSAIGKRTTAWLIVHGFRKAGYKAELIGTGQTAWLQGAKYSMIMDSCINDFVSGEIENAVVSAWKNEKPDVVVIEGQGSLMNPAYPGGFEILAAGRPDYVVLQHAPEKAGIRWLSGLSFAQYLRADQCHSDYFGQTGHCHHTEP